MFIRRSRTLCIVSLEENNKNYLEKCWQEAYKSLNKIEKAQSNETKYLRNWIYKATNAVPHAGSTDAENSILYFLGEKNSTCTMT